MAMGGFEPRQRRAHTKVRAITKGEMLVGSALDVETIRAGEHRRVPVRRPQHLDEQLALLNAPAPDVDVFRGDPTVALEWALVAQHLLDGRRDHFGVLQQLLQLVPVSQQCEHAAGYQVRRRLMPADEHRDAGRDQFLFGQSVTGFPDHTRMRHLVQKAFTPRTINALADYVKDIVERLIDAVEDKGEMDIIWDLSYPLPITVIAELMGVPIADHAKLKHWSGKIVEFMATPKPTTDVLLGSQDALLALQDYFRSIFKLRRSDPRDDLISMLVTVEEAGDRLTEEELISTCVTVLIGGHETTTNLISSGMLALLRDRDQLQKLLQHPEMVATAVEEMLRYESPFQRNRRIATEDVDVGGRRIEKGQLLVQMLGAANRDPAVFPSPDCFDIERRPNKHLSFGYGPHFCVGAPLARLEAPIAINALLRRLPNLEIAMDELIWKNEMFRGLERLTVRFG